VTDARREDGVLSGWSLTLALVAIAFLAFVLPPGIARWLQQTRIARAVAQLDALALALTHAGASGFSTNPHLREIGVLSGPGDAVTEARDRDWIVARAAPLQSYVELPATALAPDPWLRALLINVGAPRAGGQMWVLSAGPNGIVETPFVSPPPGAPGGDDIAVRLP
jgi:hypothetical protein